MENYKKMENHYIKETLTLTKHVFSTLAEEVINHFKATHNLNENYKESQLFGFGNYNEDKPNLKRDLELISKSYVNGKYLYNKIRELATGINQIKISRDYKYIFFNYIGFKDVYEYIESNHFTQLQRLKQMELLQNVVEQKDYYYIAYYINEDFKVNRGNIHITKQWRYFEIKFIYNDETNNNPTTYYFFGNIIQSEGFAFLDSKYIIDGKKKEGAKFTFYVGKSTPDERLYLTGTYSGFDKYENIISGKMILKKMDSLLETEKEMTSTEFDPVLCQELYKQRLVIESNIRKNPLLFSKKSPYAQAFTSFYGKTIFTFLIDNKKESITCNIERYHLNIKSLNPSVYIEHHKIDIINKGQVITIDLTFTGLFYLQKATLYLNAFTLYNNEKGTGTFVGVDVNNSILSGKIIIQLLTK